MVFNWHDYLRLAEILVRGERPENLAEAIYRTAVSRAYYAAFCLTRNYAEDKLGYRRKGNHKEHGELREYLKKQGKVKMASRLNRLRSWRNKCDYKDRVSELHQLAHKAIREAQQVLREIF